ncbi:MAG TPA: hypothetical protein VMB21_08285, partial [Candidatus Limnocylindria bacterium]|nr:hypothetical protein [Candidatus Limnocylindria bacterium]
MSIVILTLFAIAADPAAQAIAPKDALQPFNLLVGAWKGSGAPEGTRDERAAGAWSETIEWIWKFKGSDAWLAVTFEKGKHFTTGELHYTASPAKKDSPKDAEPRFTLTLTAPDKSTSRFVGTLKDKVLTLDRADGPADEQQRLVISLLHHNRYLYR